MHLLEVLKKLDDQLEEMAKTGQNRSFCTDITLLLNDPDKEPAWYHYQIVNTIQDNQNMPYEVDPIDQTREPGQKLIKIGCFVPTLS